MVWLMRGAPTRRCAEAVVGLVLAVIAASILASPTAAVVVPSPPGQFDTTSVTSPSGVPAAVDCPTETHCVMIDQSGHARVYDGSSWSAPQLVDPAADVLMSSTWLTTYLVSLSCPSAGFCMAADATSNLFTFDGTSWRSSPVPETGGASNNDTRVSCASSAFCMATWNTTWSTWNGTEWSAPVALPQFSSIGDISCPAAGYCIGIGDSKAYRFDGTSWTDLGYVFSNPADYQNASISCPTSTFCGAIDGTSEAFLVDGSWTVPEAADPVGGGVLNAPISCVDNDTCLVVAPGNGNVRVDSPATQSASTSIDANGGLRALSCRSATMCVAADRFGYVTRMTDGAWSTPAMVDPGRSSLTTLSCGSADSCVAMDGSGNALGWNGSAWSSPTAVDPRASWLKVSCPTADFCAATGNLYDGSGGGILAVWQEGRWSSVETVVPFDTLSCSDSSFCVAAGNGLAQAWDGSSWSATANPAFGGSGLSCPADGWCFTGTAIYDQGTWVPAPTPPSGVAAAGRNAVWCLSTTDCLVDSGSSVARFDDAAWTARTGLSGDGGMVQCASAALCIAAGAPSIGGAYAGYLLPGPAATSRRTIVASDCPTIDVCIVMDQQDATVWRTGFAAPRITAQPGDATAVAGTPVTLKVDVSASPAASLRWQASEDGTAWTDISGAGDTEVVSDTGTRRYRAIATNAFGEVTSAFAVITRTPAPATGGIPSAGGSPTAGGSPSGSGSGVKGGHGAPTGATGAVAPAITLQPVSRRARLGAAVTLRSAASGSPVPTVVWGRKLRRAHGWRVLSGARSRTLRVKVTKRTAGARYRARFTNAAGRATSRAVAVKAR